MRLFIFISCMVICNCFPKMLVARNVVLCNSDTIPNDNTFQHYVPLKCTNEIDLKKLYGAWRSIGNEYNDATYNYLVIVIEPSGNWLMDRVDHGTITHRYAFKIVSLKKSNIIQLKSTGKDTTNLYIEILSDSCFQFVNSNSQDSLPKGQTWRLNRLSSYSFAADPLSYPVNYINGEKAYSPDTAVVEDVSLIKLIANPEKYNGKKVRVTGYLSVVFEGQAIYLHEEDYRHGITENALSVSFAPELEKQTVLPTFHKKWVQLVGVFFAFDRPDFYAGKIAKIESIRYYGLSQ